MPSTRFLGLEILEVAHGRACYQMAVRPELTFDGSIVQGGLVAVLADYAAVAAAAAGSDLDVGWRVATLSGQTHNLAPAAGRRLVAVGEIVRPGRRHMVAKADVHIDEPDGPLCLTGLFTAAGIPPA